MYPVRLAHVYSAALLPKVRQIAGQDSKLLALFPFPGANIGISALF